ncbi:MAG: phosphatidylglycerophosphatase A, partial [Ignavibacteria bacterium]
TFGSLFGLLFFFIKGFEKIEILLAAIIICFLAGVVTSKVMMRRFGEDPSVVVIDEVVGMWTTVLVFMILSGNYPDLKYFLILFAAFRFFDIFKIQPAKYFDGLDTGFGIMMDDLIAGIYAGITVYLISLLIA